MADHSRNSEGALEGTDGEGARRAKTAAPARADHDARSAWLSRPTSLPGSRSAAPHPVLFRVAGPDPGVSGPARQLPRDVPLLRGPSSWMRGRLRIASGPLVLSRGAGRQ